MGQNISFIKMDQNISFITKWRINGTDKTLKLPLIDSGNYDFIVNWGDGTEEDHITTFEASHIYHSEGIYQVSITGTIVGWKATDTPEYKLLDVSQWGCLKLGNEGYYFNKCREMDITATDAPDLSETTNLSYMFGHCSKFNGKIGHWNVSRVTDMTFMFYNARNFNQDISRWNVSRVTKMQFMFYAASSFNKPIGEWDVSSVTDMFAMFAHAFSFNQPIASVSASGGWNVSRVTDMNSMFSHALVFNQDISRWDVSSVTDMYCMFDKATSFINGPYLQNLDNWNILTPDLLDTLLGHEKTISFRRLYIISWDKWVNGHPNKTFTEYTCSICLTDLSTDDTWRAICCPATIIEGIPHCFHKECIEGWLNITQGESNTCQVSPACPVCRRNAIAIK